MRVLLGILVVFCSWSCDAFLPALPQGQRKSTTLMKATEQESHMGLTRRSLFQSAVLGALAAPFLTASPASAKAVKRLKNAPQVDLGNGVAYQDMAIGDGKPPKPGDKVAMHFSIYYNGFEVESSRDSSGTAATPLGFTWMAKAGKGGIWPGVQDGMEGMLVGSRRKITVPSDIAFGKEGKPPFIPPGVKVLFDVSVWSIKPAGTNPNLTLSGQQNYF